MTLSSPPATSSLMSTAWLGSVLTLISITRSALYLMSKSMCVKRKYLKMQRPFHGCVSDPAHRVPHHPSATRHARPTWRERQRGLPVLRLALLDDLLRLADEAPHRQVVVVHLEVPVVLHGLRMRRGAAQFSFPLDLLPCPACSFSWGLLWGRGVRLGCMASSRAPRWAARRRSSVARTSRCAAAGLHASLRLAARPCPVLRSDTWRLERRGSVPATPGRLAAGSHAGMGADSPSACSTGAHWPAAERGSDRQLLTFLNLFRSSPLSVLSQMTSFLRAVWKLSL